MSVVRTGSKTTNVVTTEMGEGASIPIMCATRNVLKGVRGRCIVSRLSRVVYIDRCIERSSVTHKFRRSRLLIHCDNVSARHFATGRRRQVQLQGRFNFSGSALILTVMSHVGGLRRGNRKRLLSVLSGYNHGRG